MTNVYPVKTKLSSEDIIQLKVGDKINCYRKCHDFNLLIKLEKCIEIISIHEGNIIVVEKWNDAKNRRYYNWDPNFYVFSYELL
jgi:hypothetical protein